MGIFSNIVETLFDKELEGIYALLFLLFIIIIIGFVSWAIYYAVGRKAMKELTKIKWLDAKTTLNYSVLSISVIVLAALFFFFIDLGIDSLLGIII